MPLEERLYRHRCVEAWSMAVPWTGFPLKALVDYRQAARPAPNMCGWRPSWIRKIAPGPAAILVSLALRRRPDDGGGDQRTRLHRHRHVRQAAAASRTGRRCVWRRRGNTASNRSNRSSRITFTDERPETFWESLQADEYGFWANVNPDVPHPRWSQATEDVLGTGERRPDAACSTAMASKSPDFTKG